jgi:hypothetical protein
MNPAYDRSRVTPLGQTLGRQNARLVQPAIDALVAEGEPDERCNTCAFRLGTVPNGCEQTQMDALKCVMEAEPFGCHVHDGKSCHGWYAARVSLQMSGKAEPVMCPWEFSEPDEE